MNTKLQLLALVAAAALSTSALAQVRTGVGDMPDYPKGATASAAAGAGAGVAAALAAPAVGEAPSYPLAQGGAQSVAASGRHAMRMGVKHNHENFQKSPN